jgi:hypothetical protein
MITLIAFEMEFFELDDVNFINELINAGALLNIKDNDGETVIEYFK